MWCAGIVYRDVQHEYRTKKCITCIEKVEELCSFFSEKMVRILGFIFVPLFYRSPWYGEKKTQCVEKTGAQR